MEQPEQYQLTQMVNHTMVFIARCFLIPATLQFIVITRYYASLRLAGNKNQRTLNPIQLRILGSNELSPGWQRFRDDRHGVFFIGGGDHSHSIVAGGFPEIS
jgi:hypothetical protein